MAYSLSEVRRAISRPRLALYELNRLYYRKGNLWEYNENGVDIFDEDWDFLIILDACRFDMFERNNTLPGTLSSRRSRGSNTSEFLRGNFSGKELLDTVYLTANPQFHRHQDEIETTLHSVINIWQEEGWDEDLGTVLPETTTEYAKRAANRYPNKRIVVHFLQPHYPFIDPQTTFDKGHLQNHDIKPSFWRQLRMNDLDVPVDRIWEAYLENFETVLPHVQDLLASLEGRTVVTSDHGNMFGERCFPIPVPGWGHPKGIYSDELVKVPWLVYETGTRRTILEDPPDNRKVDEGQAVEERLKQLGYAN